MIAAIDAARRLATRWAARFEVDRPRRAGRARQLRAVGPQARRPARAGADVDPRHQGAWASALASPRRPSPGSQVHDEILPAPAPTRPAAAVAAHQPRRRPRGRRDQRRGHPRHGYMKPIATLMKPLPSVDLDDRPRRRPPSNAATSAPCRPRPSSAKRWWRSCSPTPFLEKFGGDSIGETSSAQLDAWRRARARAVRRRASGLGEGRRRRHDSADRPVRRRHAARAGRARRTTSRPEIAALIDDMVETMYAAPGRRPGGAAGRRAAAHVRHRPLASGATRTGCIVLVNPEFVERDGMQLEEEGCLSVPGLQRHGGATGAGGRQGARPRRAREHRRGHGAARARASSTRWIISTARCSSTACAASSGT